VNKAVKFKVNRKVISHYSKREGKHSHKSKKKGVGPEKKVGDFGSEKFGGGEIHGNVGRRKRGLSEGEKKRLIRGSVEKNDKKKEDYKKVGRR